jgi:hypothetical protein
LPPRFWLFETGCLRRQSIDARHSAPVYALTSIWH